MRPTLLVSAGPTREYIDDVRYITNGSSGQMGMAVAAAAADSGWLVHLALGPSSVPPPTHPQLQVHPFTSATDLDDIAQRVWPEVDAFVATAAVGDYRPRERFAGKKKKGESPWILELVRNPDVLARRGEHKGQRTLVGFALESQPRREEALRKLVEKGLDLIILNGTANLGSTAGDFDWIEAGGNVENLTALSKGALAQRIVSFLDARCPKQANTPKNR